MAKSAFEQVLDSVKNTAAGAAKTVSDAWNSDYNIFAQKNLAPIVKSGTDAIKWSGDRAGTVLNDVVENPGKYSVFNELASGKLTQPLGEAANKVIMPVAQKPAQFLDKTLFSAPRLFSNAYKTTESLGKGKPLDAAGYGARSLYDALWFMPGVQGAPLTNNMLQNLVIWPTVDATMGGIRAARKGEDVIKGATDNAASQTPFGLGDAITDNEAWARGLNLAQIIPVMVGAHYMGKFKPGDTVINNLKTSGDDAVYSLKGVLNTKKANTTFADLAKQNKAFSPVEVRNIIHESGIANSVFGKKVLLYADEAEKAGKSMIMALDGGNPRVQLVAPEIAQAAQSIAQNADNVAPQLDDTAAQVKMMITKSERQALADLGYTADDVSAMTPQTAEQLINNNFRKVADGVAPPPVDMTPAPPTVADTASELMQQHQTPYLTPDVADAMAQMKSGKKMSELAKDFNSGVLQEANQRLKGVGLLADLDAAFKAENYSDVVKFANDMIGDVKTNGAQSPYVEYIDGLKDYLKFTPNVDQAAMAADIDNTLASLKAPATSFSDQIPTPPQGKETLGFVETSLESPNVTNEVKQSILDEGPRMFYEKGVNKESLGRVQELVSKDPEIMLQRAMSGEKWTNNYDDLATNYLVLAQKYMKEGKPELAREMTFKLAETANKYGQFNQALSMLNRLTPEGQLMYVQRTIKQLTPQAGRTQADDIARQIAGSFDDINTGAVDDVVKRTVEKFGERITDVNTGETGEGINGAIAKIKGAMKKTPPEKQLATKVGTQITPPVVNTDPVKDMVNTLYQVAKDDLPKKAVVKRDPMDFISLAMNQREKYGEVWDKAQQIVKNKYADNPEALAMLDDYFNKALTKPFSDKLIERAVSGGVRDLGMDLNDIVRQRQSTQAAAQKSLTDELMSRGWIIDPDNAAEVEKYIGDQFSKVTGARKRQILESMLEGVKGKGQVEKSAIDRVIELSNMGALDNQQYYEIVARKMKLPVMTEKMAESIRTHMATIQEIDDSTLSGYIQKNRTLRTMYQEINEQIPRTWQESLDDYRYRNMLMGPQTQLRNIVGNIGQTFVWRPANLTVQEIMDRLPIKGRTKTNADVVKYYRDVFNAFGDAGDAFTDVMHGRAPAGEMTSFMDYRGDVSPDFVGLGGRSRLPFIPNVGKFMEATDAYFSTMISAGEYSRLKSMGMSDIDSWKGAQKIAQDYLYRGQADPEETAILVKAVDKAQGALTSGINGFKIGGIRPFSWFVPFTKIANNMTKAFMDYSPVGFINAAGTADDMLRAERQSRAIVGTTMMGLGTILAANGQTTWSAPKDKTARDLFYAEKMKPYSIKIGGVWVPMTYFGPAAFALAVPAAIKQAWVDDPNAQVDGMWEKGAKSVTNVFQFLGGQSYISGIAMLSDALSGNSDTDLSGAVTNIATQLIPGAGFNRYVNTVIDPYYKKSSDALGQFIKSVPLGTFVLDSYETPDGDPEARDWFNALLPYEVGVPRGEYGQDYTDRIQTLQENAVDKKEEDQGDDKKASTFDKLKALVGIEPAAAEENPPTKPFDWMSTSPSSLNLPTDGVTAFTMDGQPTNILSLQAYLAQEDKGAKLTKAYLSGDPKKIERELQKHGMTPDEGMVAMIKSLNPENRAEFVFGEMSKEGFTPQMLNTLIDNKLVGKTEAEWMARKGLINGDGYDSLVQVIENRESELGILGKKDPKYLASVLTKQPPKDDTEAMNLVKQSILTDDVINKMLLAEYITPEYGKHLKDMIHDYKVAKGILKGGSGKKPKKADIGLLKIPTKATPKLQLGSNLKPRSVKSTGLAVKSAVPKTPAKGAVSNKLPAQTKYSFSQRLPLQVRNTMTTRISGLGR